MAKTSAVSCQRTGINLLQLQRENKQVTEVDGIEDAERAARQSHASRVLGVGWLSQPTPSFLWQEEGTADSEPSSAFADG